MRIRDRLHIPERRQRQAAWAMELSLVGFLFVGLDRGNVGIVVNAGVALVVTQLPAVLERDYNIAMDPALVLWLTTAVFLHALGTLGPYRNVWWWDHLTHVLSSSLVGAAGYAFVRVVDQHVPHLRFTRGFVFVFLLLVVIAFGVLWEVVEFGLGGLAGVLGSDAVLTQYGLGDTMVDLVFDAVGGLVVAVWGTAYVTDVAGDVAAYLARRRAPGE